MEKNIATLSFSKISFILENNSPENIDIRKNLKEQDIASLSEKIENNFWYRNENKIGAGWFLFGILKVFGSGIYFDSGVVSFFSFFLWLSLTVVLGFIFDSMLKVSSMLKIALKLKPLAESRIFNVCEKASEICARSETANQYRKSVLEKNRSLRVFDFETMQELDYLESLKKAENREKDFCLQLHLAD